ncbi:MAG: oligoendopeptidase, partial [Acidimicrobiia bacterium]|nr:oligoendopeptidase [Acidimicrobiia bacterium]
MTTTSPTGAATGSSGDATSVDADADRTAADVAWDIETLVDGKGAAGVEMLLDEAATSADALGHYRGRLGELDVSGLTELMHEIGRISELIGRAGS